MARKLILVSVPGLRARDIDDPALTPNLCRLAREGASVPMRPGFPCVTSPVQAGMLTGVHADRHGVIANGFYYRDRREVALWTARNDVIEAPQVWSRLKEKNPSLTSAVWHAQNIRDADAAYIITPAPIHQPDGSEKPWCYDKPAGLYEQLMVDLGPFPLHHYWGPMAGLPSSVWISRAATWLIDRHAPDFNYVYIPHLDYAAQKAGPDSPPARQALHELDDLLGRFVEQVSSTAAGPDVRWLIASEYAMTPVRGALFPNRILRDLGLLKVQRTDGGEVIDFGASAAFAMVDHQLAHVYVQDPAEIQAVADRFRSESGIDQVLVGADRAAVHLDHPRAGEVVLISRDDLWFAYYWWLADWDAPAFARTVDIHRKPGYDPVELFFDRATKSIPLDASLVRGSHGVPCTRADHETALIASYARLLDEEPPTGYGHTDVCSMILRAFDDPT